MQGGSTQDYTPTHVIDPQMYRLSPVQDIQNSPEHLDTDLVSDDDQTYAQIREPSYFSHIPGHDSYHNNSGIMPETTYLERQVQEENFSINAEATDSDSECSSSGHQDVVSVDSYPPQDFAHDAVSEDSYPHKSLPDESFTQSEVGDSDLEDGELMPPDLPTIPPYQYALPPRS